MNNFTFHRITFFTLFALLTTLSTANAQQPLYSFKSGDYNDPEVWTLNSSGIVYDNPGAITPLSGVSGDAVVILSGRTVTISPSFPTTLDYYVVSTKPVVTIQEGAILEISAIVTTAPEFLTLYGQGTLLMHSTANLPSGIVSSSFVQSGGGTVEYNYSGKLTLPSQDTYNNLTINLKTVSDTAIVSRAALLFPATPALAPFTVNGNLTIKKGIFQIGEDGVNGTAPGSDVRLKITISGDVTVDKSGSIRVGKVNPNNSFLTAGEFAGRIYSDYDQSIPGWRSSTKPGPFYILRTGNNSKLPFKSGTYHQIHHQVYIGGSLTNNGTVKFHNLTTLDFDQISGGSSGLTSTTSGAATVFFQGLANDTLTCNGQTDFYNMVLDKGSDPTYSLTINPSTYTNFRLWGPNSVGADQNNYLPNGNPNGNPNPIMRKALWINNGTLKLTGQTVIPSLSEAGDDVVGNALYNGNYTATDPTGDFYIPANGAMVIDGPEVIVLTTADYASEVALAYGLSTANVQGVIKDQRSGNQSLSIYGSFIINSGYISGRESAGFIYWSTAGGAGNFTINGGIVDAKQFRSAEKTPVGRATFTMTGGTLRLRGRFQNFGTDNVASSSDIKSTGTGVDRLRNIKNDGTGALRYSTIRAINGLHGGISTFNILSPANVFTMSAGEITILDVCEATNLADSSPRLALDINSSSTNANVTGGTLNIQVIPKSGNLNESFVPGANSYEDRDYYVKSTAPIYNLNVNRIGISPTPKSVILNTQNLTVKNNIVVDAQVFNATSVFNANNLNVNIGGDYYLQPNAIYTTGTNTTTFNGIGNQNFLYSSNNNITFTGSTLGLNNLAINKSAGTLAMGGNGTDLTINGNLSLLSGTFDDGGVAVTVKGNVTNSSTHISTNGGKIILSGTALQNIDGNGNGIFSNLQLNNANGAKFISAGQTFSGQLRLENGILDIGIYPLIVTSALSTAISPNTSTGVYSNTNMIRTSGNQSDGGIIKKYGDISPFIFPVGTFNGTSDDYTPATIAVTASTYGSITVKPVSRNHPFATGSNNLNRYWKVVAGTGFSANPTVSHTYQYVPGDVTPAAGADVSDPYLAAVFNPNAWLKGANVPGNNTFSFPNLTYIAGEFTAGKSNNFGAITAFYSRNNGNWNTPATWSTDPLLKWAGAATSSFPTASNPVYIGDGALKNHTITISTPSQSAGILQLSKGSTLNVGTTIGHDFGALDDSLKIVGAGTLRISSATATAEFPKGDFGNFLGAAGGTVDYYATSTSFNIPLISADGRNLATYDSLIITPGTGLTITMPDRDIRLYGNLIINGASSTGIARLNDGVTATAHTLTINGSIAINGGRLRFMNTATRNIVLDGFLSTTLDGNGNRVNGRITIRSTNGAGIDVDNVSGPIVTHTLSLVGSIFNDGTINFRPNSGIVGICNITFTGVSNETITGTNTGGTRLNTLTINKGTSQAPVLTLNLTGNTAGLSLPANNWLSLQNGTFQYVKSGNTTAISITNNNNTFQIPATAAFTMDGVSGTTVTFLNTASSGADAADLLLNGKLTVKAGTVNVGPSTAPAFNHDIEYAAAGLPEIEVTGGRLYVNGQIRRPAGTNITLGSLVYNQTGGDVIIGGNSSATGLAVANTRAKFEIDNGNNGSQFNMSGGTLTILRGSGNVSDYGDLYIHPGSSSVTGGTIILAPGTNITLPALSSGGNQTYTVNSNVDLFNMTVGDGGAYSSIAQVNVNPLRLLGDLDIKSNSTLDTKGLNVRLSGNFTNSGIYLPGANTTTFNGNTNTFANLNSPTAFNNLTINKSGGSLTLAGTSAKPAVVGNLTLTNGTLNDGGRILLTMGNIANSALHTSAGGKIDLQLGVQSVTFTPGSYQLPSITAGTGTGASFKMTIVDGKITAITVASGGTGYPVSGNLIFGSGSATANFIATTTGVITAVNVTNGGSGYGPAVTVGNSSTNNNAILQTILTTTTATSASQGQAVVSAVNIIYPGSDYSSAPTTTVSPDAALTPATADVFPNSVKNILFGNGSGQFGNLSINNPGGAELAANMTVNGALNLAVDGTGSDGLLYVNNSKLTLGVNATIMGVSTTSTQRFIRTNGVLSDGGLEKVFANNLLSTTFLFPIGVTGKYTPANYTLTTGATGGNITVKPINAKHPNVNLSLGLGPDYINYYWNVTSTVVNLTSLTHQYFYVVEVENGTPANYGSARFNNALWTTDLNTAVDEVNRIINFTNVSPLSGDYTAGESAVFQDPDTYTSNNTSMDWESTTDWLSSANVVYGPPKEGSIVIIRAGDVVTVNPTASGYITNSLTLNGTLDLGPTDLHNFGTVKGYGLLKISAKNTDFTFPAGNYDEFVKPTPLGGTVEYYGTVNGTLLTQSTFNKLIFSGSSTKELIQNILINDDLTINAGTLSNSSYNKNIILKGNWENNVGATGFVPGTGTVTFNGGKAQSIGPNTTLFNNITFSEMNTKVTNGADLNANGNLTIGTGASFQNTGNNVIKLKGNWTNNGTYLVGGGTNSGIVLNGTNQLVGGTSSTTFKNLIIEEGGKKTLTKSVYVSDKLTLTDGYIISSATNLLTLQLGASVSGGSDNSFVDGPLARDINTSGTVSFPIGRVENFHYAPVSLSGVNSLSAFQAEYLVTTPNSNAFNTPLNDIHEPEYWEVKRNSGTSTANVILNWNGSSSYSGSTVYATRFTGGVWSTEQTPASSNPFFTSGRDATTSGTVSPANVAGNSNTTDNFGFGLFTFGLVSQDFSAPLPVRLLTFQGKWNNGKVDLEWLTTSEENNSYFEVERSADAQHFVSIGGLDGKGTTNFSQRYQFTDENPLAGISYYRLKQVDSNGDFEYSKTISIANPAVTDVLVLYPNPVANSEQVSLQINGAEDNAYLVTIHDVQGKILARNEYPTVKGMNELPVLQHIHLARGMYFIRVQAGLFNRQFKLVVD